MNSGSTSGRTLGKLLTPPEPHLGVRVIIVLRPPGVACEAAGHVLSTRSGPSEPLGRRPSTEQLTEEEMHTFSGRRAVSTP